MGRKDPRRGWSFSETNRIARLCRSGQFIDDIEDRVAAQALYEHDLYLRRRTWIAWPLIVLCGVVAIVFVLLQDWAFAALFLSVVALFIFVTIYAARTRERTDRTAAVNGWLDR